MVRRFSANVAALISCVALFFGTEAIAVCDASKQCCAAGSSGATCGGSGVASQGNSSGTNLGGGNPINVVTGNKYQREVDLAPLPGVLGLEIIRHYNSSTSGLDRPAREMRGIGGTVGVLGRGWKLSYETDLYIRPDGILDVIQADGTRITFRKGVVDPSVYYPRSPSQGRIVLTDTSTKPGYVWIWNNGRRLTFDENGLLTRIMAPTGEIVTLTRTINGWLGRVTDPQGRTLILHYPTKSSPDYKTEFHGVYAIDSPVGRFGYEYGSNVPPGADIRRARLGSNLVKVTIPTFHDPSQQADAYPGRGVSSSSIARIYHYESPQFPTLLTGVTVVGQGSDGQIIQQRTGTYGYDQRGRGNLSVRGEADSHREQVTVAWPQQAQAVLTNSLGQQTIYKTATIAGEARILEVTGAGCASCGPANMRYGYDSLGRLTEETRITSTGEPIETRQTTLDGYGRPLQISRVVYQNGIPQPAKAVLRYQYAAFDENAARKDPTLVPGDQPVLIARPSVVPGMEHQLKIRYNEYGQPLTITETGYDPTEGPTTQLTRTTSYRYSLVGENSVLTEIDGPLANGPKGDPEDSDVTRIAWNKSGTQVAAVTWPGGYRSLASYDKGTGLISKVEDETGLQTSFVHNPRAELAGISSMAPGWKHPRVESFFYDAFGNRTETGTGSKTDQTYQGETRQQFDAIGRPIWIASALGFLQRFEFDTESHLLESSRSDGSMRQAQNFAYDDFGRFVAMSDSSGFDLKLKYGARGEVDQYTDSFGREHRLNGSNESPPGVQNVYDDFGRRVLSISPDSGRTTRSFDAANRMTGSVDAIGNAAKYEYNVTGRIARQTITPVATATGQPTPQVTTWTYEGRKLIAVDHPVQSEQYRYDVRGWLIAKQVTLKRPTGTELQSVNRYHYDDEGNLTSASLPDGSRMIYERNGQGQLVALRRSRIQTAWLQWLLPARRIVTEAERDLVGVKRYVTGNGIEARYQRSSEGALARIVYANARLANEADAASTVAATVAQGGPASRKDASSGASQDGPGITKASIQAPGAIDAAEIQGSLLDHRYLWDVSGNLLLTQTRVAGTVSGKPATINSYAYDENNHLSAAASPKGASRYYFDDTGNRILSQEAVADQGDLATGTRKADFRTKTHRAMQDGAREFEYDENGRIIRDGSRSYEWDALGRLIAVRAGAKLVGQYAYNHRGERVHKEADHSGTSKGTSYLYENRLLVAELNEAGNVVREYVYLGNQVVATIDLGAGHKLASAEEGTWTQVFTDFGTVIDGWFGRSETITWLHANHLGLIEAATNSDGKLVWQADYDAMGRLLPVSSGSEVPKTATAYGMNLRFPGQYHDAETGLYYNGYRYYDPDTGGYLSADPLGLPDGPNPYAYVASNPLKYIDPLGLVLFAFDGTGNSMNPPDDTSLSNVVKFRQAYDEDLNGKAYYITGIGTVDGDVDDKGNVASGEGFDKRVEQGFKFLNKEINAKPKETSIMHVDVVGFSRGAAEARVWINMLVKKLKNGLYTTNLGNVRCIDIRFEGLWDTVPHLGYLNGNESKYDFSIPSEVGYAAQAVALNEHRGASVNFNARSIFVSPEALRPKPTPNRIELGFVGSHSDIGGGYTTGDLSDVALMWIIEQGKKSGIKFLDEKIENNKWNTVSSPIIHDQRANNVAPQEEAFQNDRKFTYGDGSSVDQHLAEIGGHTTEWARSEVKYYTRFCGPLWSPAVGLVNMKAYGEWVRSIGVPIKYEIPTSRRVCE